MLLGRARQGDSDAAIRILDPFRRRILHAASILPDKDDRQSVLDDVLLDAINILTSYDEHRPLGPYVYVIARNRAKAIQRKRRLPTSPIEEFIEGQPECGPQDDPERRAIAKDELGRILGGLSTEEHIVLLACTGTLSDDDAAAQLGISPAGVRTRKSRLRHKLAAHLREGNE
ncbi:MAG: sigma-70 family RNA polymerase sigma factor [Actinomycetota bacterium]